MKILRATFFSPDLKPVSIIVREVDLIVPIEDAAELHKDSPGAFVIIDIFEMPGQPTFEDATFAAMELQKGAAERERDMALTYYWDAQMLGMTNPGGVLTMTKPAPLSADDLMVPLMQLAKHPNYERQRIVAISHDYKLVEMVNGECKVTSL